jgi:hypothetical protein
MLAPWLIEKLREREAEQAKQDRESWDRQPRIELDDEFRRPPPESTPNPTPDVDVEGFAIVDFTI